MWTVETTSARRPGLRLLVAAGAAALVHAGFSVYWAFGGRWLLDTVSAQASDLAAESPAAANAVVDSAAVVKAVAGVVPIVVEARARGALRRVVRGVGWVGGAFLVLYGGVVAGVAVAVLTGQVDPGGPIDRRAMIGHAALWDPLFALWGALLLGGLWLTRQERHR